MSGEAYHVVGPTIILFSFISFTMGPTRRH
jgi:hypothetical protein